MNKLIKNAIIYSAELPAIEALRAHLEKARFKEMLSLDWAAKGFVEIPATGELVSTFAGGLAFAVRYDTKILPASVIRNETNKRVKAIEDADGRKVGRKDRLAIRDQVTDDLLPRALHKTAVVTCFYSPEKKHLIVPVSSKPLADVVTSELVHAIGSIKTTTINVSDVKLGLTTKVKQWLEDDASGAFGYDFVPAGRVKLVGEGESVSFDMSTLERAQDGINDALSKNFQASELGMIFKESTSFRLTHEFRLKGLYFSYEPTEDAEDVRSAWEFDASIQLLELTKIIDSLCDLLGYKEPAADGKQEAAE